MNIRPTTKEFRGKSFLLRSNQEGQIETLRSTFNIIFLSALNLIRKHGTWYYEVEFDVSFDNLLMKALCKKRRIENCNLNLSATT